MDELLENQFELISTKTIQVAQVDDFKNKLNRKVFLIGKDFTSSEHELLMKNENMNFIIIRPDRYIFDAGRMKNLATGLNGLFKMIKSN